MTYYVIIRGPLGVGKTTISKKLIKKINGEYISIDKVVKENEFIGKEREDGYFTQNCYLKANKIIIPKIKDLIKKGVPVVLDGNFYWKSQIDYLIEKLDIEHYIFTLMAPLEVCIDRDSKREKTHGRETSTAIYNKLKELDYGIPIGIDRDINEAVEKILSHLPK